MLKDYRIIPQTKPTSLVILLHGVGANGQDLLGLGDAMRGVLPQTAFVSPDAPQAFDMAPLGMKMMRQWFSLHDYSPHIMQAEIEKSHPILLSYIDQLLAEFSLPASACALLGFSQGTMMSLYTGLRTPQPLAGILGFSGALFGIETAQANSQTKISLIHGTADNVVPAEASRVAAETLRAKGYTVDLHLYEGLGHSIDNHGLQTGAAFLQKIFSPPSGRR